MPERDVLPIDPTGDQRYPLALPSGSRIAERYLVQGVMGGGSAWAITYQGRDRWTEEPVLLEEFLPRALVARVPGESAVRPHSPDDAREFTRALRRFVREGEVIADLHSPALPPILDVPSANGTAYLVLRPESAWPLGEWLGATGGRLAVDRAMALVGALLEGLALLHGEGIIHRDLSPRSIAVRADATPMLLTPGAWRHIAGARHEPLAGFASIEQYGGRDVGPWTDVYGAAAVLYFLLTGGAPLSAIERAAGGQLQALASAAPDLPAGLNAVVMRALSQAPEHRPHSISELKRLLAESTQLRGPAPARQAERGPAQSFAEVLAQSTAPTQTDDQMIVTGGGATPLEFSPLGVVLPRQEDALSRFLRRGREAASRLRNRGQTSDAVTDVPADIPADIPAAGARPEAVDAAMPEPVAPAPSAPAPVAHDTGVQAPIAQSAATSVAAPVAPIVPPLAAPAISADAAPAVAEAPAIEPAAIEAAAIEAAVPRAAPAPVAPVVPIVEVPPAAIEAAATRPAVEVEKPSWVRPARPLAARPEIVPVAPEPAALERVTPPAPPAETRADRALTLADIVEADSFADLHRARRRTMLGAGVIAALIVLAIGGLSMLGSRGAARPGSATDAPVGARHSTLSGGAAVTPQRDGQAAAGRAPTGDSARTTLAGSRDTPRDVQRDSAARAVRLASAATSAPAHDAVELPTMRAPAINIPVVAPPAATLSPDALVDLRSRLSTARESTEQGEYREAHATIVTALQHIDSLSARLGDGAPASLKAMRRDFESASQRAVDACNAENELRRRRGGAPVACQ